MKKVILMGLALAMALTTTATSTMAQAVPTTEGGGTTAGIETFSTYPVKRASLQNVAAYIINITPSLSPPQNADSYSGATIAAATKIMTTGTLPTGVKVSPTDSRIIQMGVSYLDFITTANLAFYRGDFNPPSLWSNERGETVIWWLDVSVNQGNAVSLADIMATITSADGSNNTLGQSVSFTASGNSYSPAAPGIMADGTVITSGSAGQLVKRVIVGVLSKSYPVASPADVAGVRNYLSSFPLLETRIVVSVGGTKTTRALQFRLPPRLIASRGVSGSQVVTAESNGDTRTYSVEAATELARFDGKAVAWTQIGSIRSGQSITFMLAGGGNTSFVRYTPYLP